MKIRRPACRTASRCRTADRRGHPRRAGRHRHSAVSASTDDNEAAALDATLSNLRAAIELYHQQRSSYQRRARAARSGAIDTEATSFLQLVKFTSAAARPATPRTPPTGTAYARGTIPADPIKNVAAVESSTSGSCVMTAARRPRRLEVRQQDQPADRQHRRLPVPLILPPWQRPASAPPTAAGDPPSAAHRRQHPRHACRLSRPDLRHQPPAQAAKGRRAAPYDPAFRPRRSPAHPDPLRRDLRRQRSATATRCRHPRHQQRRPPRSTPSATRSPASSAETIAAGSAIPTPASTAIWSYCLQAPLAPCPSSPTAPRRPLRATPCSGSPAAARGCASRPAATPATLVAAETGRITFQ